MQNNRDADNERCQFKMLVLELLSYTHVRSIFGVHALHVGEYRSIVPKNKKTLASHMKGRLAGHPRIGSQGPGFGEIVLVDRDRFFVESSSITALYAVHHGLSAMAQQLSVAIFDVIRSKMRSYGPSPLRLIEASKVFTIVKAYIQLDGELKELMAAAKSLQSEMPGDRLERLCIFALLCHTMVCASANKALQLRAALRIMTPCIFDFESEAAAKKYWGILVMFVLLQTDESTPPSAIEAMAAVVEQMLAFQHSEKADERSREPTSRSAKRLIRFPSTNHVKLFHKHLPPNSDGEMRTMLCADFDGPRLPHFDEICYVNQSGSILALSEIAVPAEWNGNGVVDREDAGKNEHERENNHEADIEHDGVGECEQAADGCGVAAETTPSECGHVDQPSGIAPETLVPMRETQLEPTDSTIEVSDCWRVSQKPGIRHRRGSGYCFTDQLDLDPNHARTARHDEAEMSRSIVHETVDGRSRQTLSCEVDKMRVGDSESTIKCDGAFSEGNAPGLVMGGDTAAQIPTPTESKRAVVAASWESADRLCASICDEQKPLLSCKADWVAVELEDAIAPHSVIIQIESQTSVAGIAQSAAKAAPGWVSKVVKYMPECLAVVLLVILWLSSPKALLIPA
ncbi:hypothetical protein HK105_201292 [Polyrhizophydium stewartii]|uniref:Uncharacterized protein n=1 Tax=Polyrhizophydium stewartii TaxID=2732419 RepID=A0ABR4NHM9_9FUNG